MPTSTPALVMSSESFPIAAMRFGSGGTPASEFLWALAISMNRMVMSPLGFGFGFPDGLDRLNPCSTITSNEGRRDRQAAEIFLEVFEIDPAARPRRMEACPEKKARDQLRPRLWPHRPRGGRRPHPP